MLIPSYRKKGTAQSSLTHDDDTALVAGKAARSTKTLHVVQELTALSNLALHRDKCFTLKSANLQKHVYVNVARRRKRALQPVTYTS